jgi:hypothetical protein
MILTQDSADFIAKITRTLNELGEPPEGYYLRVLLMDQEDHVAVGAWSDEFGDDNWYFDTDPPQG